MAKETWMDKHVRRLYWGEPLGEVYALEVVSPRGYVLAVLRGRERDNLYHRADTMATVMGWKGAEYRERQA